MLKVSPCSAVRRVHAVGGCPTGFASRRLGLRLVVLAAGLGVGTVAHGASVTHQFAAEIASDAIFGSAAGTSFTGRFTIDTATPDASGDPSFGLYAGAVTFHDLFVGSTPVAAPGAGGQAAVYVGLGVDGMEFSAMDGGSAIAIGLLGPMGTLASDALPGAGIDLGDFTTLTLNYYLVDPVTGNLGARLEATLEDLELAAPAAAVPTPAGGVGGLVLLGGMAARRCRRR